MGVRKQRKKLFRAQEEAQVCLNRQDAKEILRKAAKAAHKLEVLSVRHDA